MKYRVDSFMRMFDEIWKGAEYPAQKELNVPLIEWVVEHPETYTLLLDKIRWCNELWEYNRKKIEFRNYPGEGMSGEQKTLQRMNCQIARVSHRLQEARDAIAEMLGYVESPEDQVTVLDSRLFPHEDEFGFPIQEEV